jgi:hypothetical protein
VWSDGSEFSFESEDELDGLQKWALDFVLAQALGKTA